MSAVMPCEIKNGELANLLTVSDAKLSAMERGKQAIPPELEPKIIRWFAHRGGASLPLGFEVFGLWGHNTCAGETSCRDEAKCRVL